MDLGLALKLRIFLWQFATDGLPISVRLFVNGVSVPLCCILCQHQCEDLLHYFVKCPFTLRTIEKINEKIAQTLKLMNITKKDLMRS